MHLSYVGYGVRPGFEPQLHEPLATWHWVSHLVGLFVTVEEQKISELRDVQTTSFQLVAMIHDH